MRSINSVPISPSRAHAWNADNSNLPPSFSFFASLSLSPSRWEKYSGNNFIEFRVILAITHARRVASERAPARTRLVSRDTIWLGWATTKRGAACGACLHTAVRAYFHSLSLFLSPRGNKYKSWAYASEVLFGVIRVTALSALLQPLKDRRRFSGREIFQTSFFVLLLHSFFFLASFLSLSVFLFRSASLFSRGEEFEEGIGGRNSWKLRKLVSLCNSYSSLRAITRRGGIIKKALSNHLFEGTFL